MTAIAALPPSVRSYVSDFVARARRLALARAVGLAAAVFLGWALACCTLERFMHFGSIPRMALVGAAIAAAAAILFRPLRIARRREADVVDAAAEIERHEPRFAQRLLTVVSRLAGPPEHR